MDNNKKFGEIEKENSTQNYNQKKKILKEGATTGTVTFQKNIETIWELEKEAIQSRSTAEHIADKITTFAGSTPFIILHVVWFGGWILINEGIIPGIAPFDPFPFSFLTLVVSLEAIFLTLLVLMSQNRMTKEADKRAHLDLQINMLDEQETTMILRMVQKIAKHLGLEEEIDDSVKDLCEETDVNRVAKTLDEKSSM
ncbi:MAG: hypothetical protein JWP81_4064 [Ferruginibacter sp.]|nr:hypothetical protein [Ferruginibacter sp.]